MKILLAILFGIMIGYGLNTSFVAASDCGSSSGSGQIYDSGGSIVNHEDGTQDYCFSSGDYNYCQKNN